MRLAQKTDFCSALAPAHKILLWMGIHLSPKTKTITPSCKVETKGYLKEERCGYKRESVESMTVTRNRFWNRSCCMNRILNITKSIEEKPSIDLPAASLTEERVYPLFPLSVIAL
jgi:hypothetical protein